MSLGNVALFARRVPRFWLIAALGCLAVALALSPRTADALTNCSVADLTYDAQEQQFLVLINQHRAANSLPALQTSVSLNRAASWMAVDMATKGYFDHTEPGGRTFSQRLTDCDDDWNSAGENIAAGSSMDTAQEAFDIWLNSPGHNANMLGSSFVQIGIARYYLASSPYKWYWVTDFHGPDDGTRLSTTPGCGAPSVLGDSDTDSMGAGYVSFNWSPVSGATSYRVARLSGGTWSTVTTTSATSYSGPDGIDDPDWRVYVATGSCAPTPGPATVFDPDGAGSCDAPSISSDSDTDSVGGGTVSFTWTPVAGANSYRISRRNGAIWMVVGTVTGTSYTGPDAADDPQWRVYIATGTCTPVPGPATAFDPDGMPTCLAPSITDHSDTNMAGAGTVAFSWNAVPGADTYRIARRNGSSWSVVTTQAGTSYSGADFAGDPDWRVYVASGSCTPVPGPATAFDP